MRRFLRYVHLFVNSLLVIGLLGAYSSRFIDPDLTIIPSFLGLTYPFWLVSNILYGLFWAIKLDKAFLLPFLAILFGWGITTDYIRLTPSMDSPDGSYTLLDHNVRLFGFYQWDENELLRDSILKRLKRERADILTFQEFYYRAGDVGFKTKPLVIDATGATYVHERYTHEFVYDQYFGVVTMSRFPIVHRGEIPFEGEINNFCIYTDILLPENDTIRVFNAHLASIHFRKADYELVEQSKNGELGRWEQFKATTRKLSTAYVIRAKQIETVMEVVASSPHPVIFAGDLNDVPVSYAYGRLDFELDDAFQKGGPGIGNTYNGAFPYLRIDHIFHSEEIEVRDYRIEPDPWSDHHPVIVNFNLP